MMCFLVRCSILGIAGLMFASPGLTAQASGQGLQVEAHLEPAKTKAAHTSQVPYPPAVLWLKPLSGQMIPPLPRRTYTLTQKDKMFTPHLLVVPAGSSVSFPNKDPYFHNVFSLFDGKRFDLGLYESGTSREVVFSREGVSYVFCNIHFDMSAVVVSLATPLYSVANHFGAFHFEAVPPGAYSVHVWIEGQPQAELDRMVHVIQLDVTTNLGGIHYDDLPTLMQHTNKFDRPYESTKPQPY